MKKIIFLIAFGAAGLLGAKNSELKLNSEEISKENVIKIKKITKAFGELQWHYLYQSSCGWTFNMTSDVGIQNMTPTELYDWNLDVQEMNDRICKLHGKKPVENFT